MFSVKERMHAEDLDELKTNLIVFDIETTGLNHNDKIVCISFRTQEGYLAILNTEGDSTEMPDISDSINEKLIDDADSVKIGLVDSEKELLERVDEFTDNFMGSDDVLVAYNGEVWGGGFDNSFIRTRCVKNSMNFVLLGCKYMDVYELIGKHGRFNTNRVSVNGMNKRPKAQFAEHLGLETSGLTSKELTETIQKEEFDTAKLESWYRENIGDDVPTHQPTSLDDVYEVLCDENIDDPVQESRDVIDLYEEGEYGQILEHNLVDVYQTSKVLLTCVKQVSSEDFSKKKL